MLKGSSSRLVGLDVSSYVRVAQSHPHQGILCGCTRPLKPIPWELRSRSVCASGIYIISNINPFLPPAHGGLSAPCTIPLELRLFVLQAFHLAWSQHRLPHSLLHSTVPTFLPLRIMSAPPIPAGLPLDDRSRDLKIPIVVLIIFSSIFVILRLYVSFRNRNFFQLTDHLLWTGHVSGSLPDIFGLQTLTVS
jgi:hypothetical protein